MPTVPHSRSFLKRGLWTAWIRFNKTPNETAIWPSFSRAWRSANRWSSELLQWYDHSLQLTEALYPNSTFEPVPENDNIFMSAMAGWHVGFEYCSYTGAEAELRMLEYRLLIQSYFRTHGHYPHSLQEVETSSSQLPVDPFTIDSQPFRYRLKYHGYEIWSVGPDGRDNGGTPIARKFASDLPGAHEYLHGGLSPYQFIWPESQGDLVFLGGDTDDPALRPPPPVVHSHPLMAVKAAPPKRLSTIDGVPQ